MTAGHNFGRGPTVGELLAEELERDADAVELQHLRTQIARSIDMLQLHVNAQREQVDAGNEASRAIITGLEDGIRELHWLQQAGAVYRAAWMEQTRSIRGLA